VAFSGSQRLFEGDTGSKTVASEDASIQTLCFSAPRQPHNGHVMNADGRDAPILSYAGAQHYLGGISRSTLKMLVASHSVGSITIGRRRLFLRDELDRYIASRLNDGKDTNG
jgi:excisionase family DNA binding protein